MDIDLKQLRDLMRAIRQFDITALTIEKKGERIELRRAANGSATPAHAAHAQTAAAPVEAASTESSPPSGGSGNNAAAAETGCVFVTSPFVGTFFRSPAPGDPPYVEVGQHVSASQTLCIVEAMKLMNEIESEYNGVIAEILAENGKPVNSVIGCLKFASTSRV